MNSPVHPSTAYNSDTPSVEDWNVFVADLQDAASRAVPTTDAIYSKVFVLTIDFAKCDFDVATDRDKLTTVLKTRFNFQVESLHIKTSITQKGKLVTKSTSDLNDEVHDYILNWLRRCAAASSTSSNRAVVSDNYGCVVYYSGHAGPDPADAKKLLLFETPTSAESIKWSSISNCFPIRADEAKALCILDCCCASLASCEANVEIMAACAWESEAPVLSSRAFTTKVRKGIEGLVRQQPFFSAAQLMDHIKHGQSAKNQKKAVQVAEPIYITDRGPDAKASFLFHRISKTSIPGQTSRNAQGKRKRIVNFGSGRIMIAIQLADETKVPDPQLWKEWLLKMPPGIEDMTIEIKDMSLTGSAIVIVVIPYVVWLLLSDNPAYRFIAWLAPLVEQDPDEPVDLSDDGENEPMLSLRSRSDMNVEAGGGKSRDK